MSSFFTLPSSQRKRKRVEERPAETGKRRIVTAEKGATRKQSNPEKRRREERDESVSGSELEVSGASDSGSRSGSESSEGEDETAGERRIRLAQRYLDNIREEVDDAGFDAADVDRDLIAERLKEDVDEAKGRQYRLIAQNLDFPSTAQCSFGSNTKSTTAVAMCPPYVYTGSKDKALIRWETYAPAFSSSTDDGSERPQPARCKKPKQVAFRRGIKIDPSSTQQHGHAAAILSLAASPNGEYVATGGADKSLIIWSTNPLKPLKTFRTHRDVVLGVSFPASISTQPGVGSQLFSASADRTLKTYSLAGPESLAYVETLFGHQDHVVGIAAMGTDQCVSVGARDRTARLWKAADESQLVFRGDSSKHDAYCSGSLECVAAIPPQHFVTGSDAGALQLWSMHKKKPLYTVQLAHGVDEPEPLEEVTSEKDKEVIERLKVADKRRPTPRHITALASVPGTDVVLSGSWDGWVKAWKVSDDKRALIPLGAVGQSLHPTPDTNGIKLPTANGQSNEKASQPNTNAPSTGAIRGIVNSLAVFERRKEILNEFGVKKESESLGLCIVAGTGKEPRLGRWRTFPDGKNGAMIFEVPLKRKELVKDVDLGGES